MVERFVHIEDVGGSNPSSPTILFIMASNGQFTDIERATCVIGRYPNPRESGAMLHASKYFRPMSLTWHASLMPILAGLFIAFEPVHHLADWVKAVSRIFGDTSPYLLINAGLVGIGLRGAVRA